jgi:hypothetical protein
LATFLVVVACGGHKQTEATSSCATAAQHGVDAMINQAKKKLDKPGITDDVKQRLLARMKKVEGTGAKMRGVITNRCVEDKWPAAVVECWSKADELEQIRACRKQLPPDVQARLQKDELEIFVDVPDGTDVAVPAPGTDRRLQILDQAIADATKQLTDAKTAAEMDTARSQLAALQAEREKLVGIGSSAGSGAAP